LHDNATLNGATAGFTPTGAVTFTFSGGALGAAPGSPEAGFYATSGETAARAALPTAHRFSAAYAGHSNQNAISAGYPHPATFFVDKMSLTLTTTVHSAGHGVVANGAHVALGSVLHDNAALTGAVTGFTPTGAITFSFSGGALGSAPASPESGFYATSGATA